MIHELKIEAEYLEDVAKGIKSFEVRKNDRDFRIGDFLALNELTEHQCNSAGDRLYTGRCCLVEIVYVLRDERFLKDEYVVLGIRPCGINQCSSLFYNAPIYDRPIPEDGD